MIRNEFIDEVKIHTSPRYKESHLSGDEWRQSVIVELCWKGNVLYSQSFRDIPCAAAWLGWATVTDEIRFKCHDARDKIEDIYCDQPGCCEPYTVKYQCKKVYSDRGEDLARQPSYAVTQKFCARHSTRGDCDRQDADDNYIVLEGKGKSSINPDDESPSAFGGAFRLWKR